MTGISVPDAILYRVQIPSFCTRWRFYRVQLCIVSGTKKSFSCKDFCNLYPLYPLYPVFFKGVQHIAGLTVQLV
jgi:hypothetical protein